MNQEERQRQQACFFIKAIGGRIGLYVISINCLCLIFIRPAVLERQLPLHKTCITAFTSTFRAKTSAFMSVSYILMPGLYAYLQPRMPLSPHCTPQPRWTLKKPQDILNSPLP